MQALNLLAHCGAQKISRADLALIETPQGTDTHITIAHGDLLQLVTTRLAAFGLRIVQDVHAVSPERDMYFGMLQVFSGEGEFATVLGLRNSHNKRFPAGLVCGSGVFVCDNLCFSGEVKIGRKHTKNIWADLPNLVEVAVSRVVDLRAFQARRIESYHGHRIGESAVNNLLIKAFDLQIISSAKIGQVLQEWREPSYPEFAAQRDAWRLFNAFTQVLKPRKVGQDIFTLPAKTQRLHEMLDEVTGIGPAPQVRAIAA